MYERDHIELWMATNPTSPQTRGSLSATLTSIHLYRTQIDAYLLRKENADLFENNDVYLPRKWWIELEEAISKKDLSKFKTLVEKDPRLLTLSPQLAKEKSITLFKPNDRPCTLTAAQMARKYGALNIINDIRAREGLPVEDCISDSDALFILAVEQGDLKSVKQYCGEGIININALGESGNNALQRALKYGHLDIANYLLQQGIDVHHRNSHGETAAHLAAARSEDDHEMLLLLKEHGADLDAIAEHQRTPLHYAARAGAVRTAQYLISERVDINALSDFHQTPLFTAAYYSSDRSIDRIFRIPSSNAQAYLAIIASLIKAGANPNLGGRSALNVCGSNEITHLLLASGAKISSSQDSPLVGAEYEMAKIILIGLEPEQAKAHLDGKKDCIMSAVEHGSLELLQLYIDHGANVNFPIQNYWGTSPLEYALHKSGTHSAEKIDMLLKAGAKLSKARPSHMTAPFSIGEFRNRYDIALLQRIEATTSCETSLASVPAVSPPRVNNLVAKPRVSDPREKEENSEKKEKGSKEKEENLNRSKNSMTAYRLTRNTGGSGSTLFNGYTKNEKLAASLTVSKMLDGTPLEKALVEAISCYFPGKQKNLEKIKKRIMGAMNEGKLGELFNDIKAALSEENAEAVKRQTLN